MYQPHELALLLPPIPPGEFEELKNDIRENGLIDPITLYEGKILDGVNRAAVCAELGVKPRYEQYEGDQPAAFVASKNVYRRQLTLGQRAAIGAELKQRFEAEARRRMEAGKTLPDMSGRVGTAAEQAATIVGVSESSVEKAARVKKTDAKAFKDLKAGKASIREAERRAIRKARGVNWNGETNAGRQRELFDRKRRSKGKPDTYVELLRLQIAVSRATRALEPWDVQEFTFDAASADLGVDLLDDVITLSEWAERTATLIQGWFSDSQIRERIAKLRDTTGRTEKEAETALRIAARLERKLEARLTAA